MHDREASTLAPSSVWREVADATVVTAARADAALTAMELGRSRHLTDHLPAAERLITLAAEFGRRDLERRARLIRTDIAARSGEPFLPLITTIEEIQASAERDGDDYIVARAHFLKTWIQHALGDLATARISGIRSVDLLPDDAPPGIFIDHLLMLAVASGPGPESQRCYARALDLAAITGDVRNALRIHNSVAFNACRSGDAVTSLRHVERLLELSTTHGMPLQAAPLETVAQAYILNGRYTEAIEVLRPVVDDPETALADGGGGVLYTGQYVLPECYTSAARAYRLLGENSSAQELLERAKKFIAARGLRHSLARVLAEQAEVYAAGGDFERAYRQHVEFHELTTALHSEEEESRARLVQVAYDAREVERDGEQFRELAMRDPLTGMYNRRFVDRQLTVLTADAAERGVALSAAIVDADFFKRINDELSHEVGDTVLRTLADLMASHVVPPETVGRIGGEEFVVLMPGLGAGAATARCEELRAAIAGHDWEPITGALTVTVSIGVATAADGRTSPTALLSDADRNLYAAKRSGRNRVFGDAR